MELAANELYHDYATDKDLTMFTNIDCEHFISSKVRFG